ncbi:MAG: hypothetical protein V7K47_02580 [Nostoc sp.]
MLKFTAQVRSKESGGGSAVLKVSIPLPTLEEDVLPTTGNRRSGVAPHEELLLRI